MFRRMTAMTLAMALCAGTAMAQEAGKPDQKDQPKQAQPKAEQPKKNEPKKDQPKKEGVTLKVGDKAPALEVSDFVKGDKVKALDESKVYVVEFWATWCGPCKQSIPHLTELQHQFKDVKFIGVSVWEPDFTKVAPFVKDMGDKMDYTVATDELSSPVPSGVTGRKAQEWAIEHGKMSTKWLSAAGQHGIPSAFVIKNNKIAWIGHPMSGLEEAIKKAQNSGKADLGTSTITLVSQPEKADKGDAKKADSEKAQPEKKPAKAELPTLMLGDKAPELAVSKFVKGEPVTGFEKGKTYVVEFWATWCGPCRISIPHLTELQKANPDVKFIGVSVWETDQAKVEPFVKEMGDKMDYAVAMDDVPAAGEGSKKKEKGKMDKAWMAASGSNGIPTAFIVNGQGKVAWIGHPSELEEPLGKIKSGDWDLAAEAKKYRDAKENEAKVKPLQDELAQAFKAQDWPAAIKTLDRLMEIDPSTAKQYANMKFRLLLTEAKDYDRAYAFAAEAADGVIKDDAQSLNSFAWTIVDPDTSDEIEKKDLKVALKLAKRADEVSKHQDAAILDTLARVYFVMGDTDKALETQKKALGAVDTTKNWPEDQKDQLREEIQSRLDEYKEKAGKGGDKKGEH